MFIPRVVDAVVDPPYYLKGVMYKNIKKTKFIMCARNTMSKLKRYRCCWIVFIANVWVGEWTGSVDYGS